jgi:hypothetical protein
MKIVRGIVLLIAKEIFRTGLDKFVCRKIVFVPFVRNRNFSFEILIVRTILLLIFRPRAMPWAKINCLFRTKKHSKSKNNGEIFDPCKSSYEATLLLKKVAWRRPLCNKLQIHMYPIFCGLKGQDISAQGIALGN